MNSFPSTEFRRAGLFTAILLLINVVGDGWSGRADGIVHQLALLPVTFLFLYLVWRLLFLSSNRPQSTFWTPRRALVLAAFFELGTAALFRYQSRHFAVVGYRLHPLLAAGFFLPVIVLLPWLAFSKRVTAGRILGVSLGAYIGGLLLAIYSFPLTYLRSDMMPVILWADTSVLHHIDPYITMHVGWRVYDFPYLPGMIVAYLPVAAEHLDLRFASIFYVSASAALIFWAARVDRRNAVAVLLGLFLLCPYLQYRHELYLSPHWFTMVATFVLMQRRHFAWAAFMLGIGVGIYQFSWIILPFVLLYALRRRGWVEAIKQAVFACLGALVIVGPFLAAASRRIASNTVGQWGQVAHANAEPMNLSYFTTYLMHPDKLLRLQAVLMIAIFAYCFLRGRCGTLEDTLRWIVVALTVFILFNVLVDGYFYLMLLVPMIAYTCVANGWWRERELVAV